MNRKQPFFFISRKQQRMDANDKGFTLIELLIALTIFAVGILAVASMQIASINGNSTSAGVTDAATQAAAQIETLMEKSWDDSDLDASNNPHQITQGIYTITWTVTDDDVISNTKTVSLTVAWTERGNQKQVVLQQVIPRII